MRRLPILLVLLVPLVLALAACGGEEELPRTGGDVPVYTDAGTEIQVAAGDRFAVELPANPSTGYRWEVEVPAGLVQESDEVLPVPEESEGMAGAGTTQRWEFLVETAETGVLVFSDIPPGQDEPERTVEFDLVAG